jgi:hypothetical protein
VLAEAGEVLEEEPPSVNPDLPVEIEGQERLV